jgi:hypothetical protein
MTGAAAAVVRKEKKVVRRFREAGATSTSTAQPLEHVGVTKGLGLRRLRERAVIREAASNRYYLDEEVWEAVRRMRRRVVAILLVIGVALLLTGVLARWLAH